jgi:hypothetical protein
LLCSPQIRQIGHRSLSRDNLEDDRRRALAAVGGGAPMDSRRAIARQVSPAGSNKCFASIIAIVDAFPITGLLRWKCRRMSSRSKDSGTMAAHHAPITGRL